MYFLDIYFAIYIIISYQNKYQNICLRNTLIFIKRKQSRSLIITCYTNNVLLRTKVVQMNNTKIISNIYIYIYIRRIPNWKIL